MDVKLNMTFDNAVFRDSFLGVRFDASKIEGSASFYGTGFHGPASLGFDVTQDAFFGDFDAVRGCGSYKSGAVFLSQGDTAGFRFAHAGRTLDIACVRFYGQADFSEMQVGRALDATATSFGTGIPATCQDASVAPGLDAAVSSLPVRFSNIKVGTNAKFDCALFGGDADFTHADIGGDLSLDGAVFDRQRALRLDLARIGAKLNMDHAALPAMMTLSDASYQRISAQAASSSSNSPAELLRLIANQPRYSPGVYADLEDALRRQGLVDEANQVFVARKQHDRASLEPLGQGVDYVVDATACYGRCGPRAFLVALGVIALGFGVFTVFAHRIQRTGPAAAASVPPPTAGPSPESVPSPATPTAAPIPRGRFSKWRTAALHPARVVMAWLAQRLHLFWYSLDLFMPFASLGVESQFGICSPTWNPQRKKRSALDSLGVILLQVYTRLHKAAGWILLAIGLAAVTGAIK